MDAAHPRYAASDAQLQAETAAVALKDTVGLDGVGAVPSMFCFSIVLPSDHDIALVRWQHQQKVSIFRCKEAAVFTNATLELSGVAVHILDSEIGCRHGVGADWSFNAWMFIGIWRAVVEHGRWQDHDWTVKVDTNAVFFPERLGFILDRHNRTSYLTSCKVGLHAPVQVLSRDAVAVLAEDYAKSWDGKSPQRCLADARLLEFGNCTRDSFLDVCLSKVLLSSTRTVDENLACDATSHCKEAEDCSDDRASFHPHDTVEGYGSCVRNSMGVAGRL